MSEVDTRPPTALSPHSRTAFRSPLGQIPARPYVCTRVCVTPPLDRGRATGERARPAAPDGRPGPSAPVEPGPSPVQGFARTGAGVRESALRLHPHGQRPAASSRLRVRAGSGWKSTQPGPGTDLWRPPSSPAVQRSRLYARQRGASLPGPRGPAGLADFFIG